MHVVLTYVYIKIIQAYTNTNTFFIQPTANSEQHKRAAGRVIPASGQRTTHHTPLFPKAQSFYLEAQMRENGGNMDWNALATRARAIIFCFHVPIMVVTMLHARCTCIRLLQHYTLYMDTQTQIQFLYSRQPTANSTSVQQDV